MSRVRFWIKCARSIALPQSVLPAVLAVSMGGLHVGFSWWLSIVALVGVVCAHLGMNLADDYFDYKNGIVDRMSRLGDDSIRLRMEKCWYIIKGEATVRQTGYAVLIFLCIAVICGAVVLYFRGGTVLWLMLAGGVLGLSYSGKPLRLSFHGYGELVIGLLFGPLLMAGMQVAACGVLDWSILLMGVAVGLLVTNIVYTHSVIDADNDKKSDKMTFARLLGSDKAELAASSCFSLLPFVIVYVAVAIGIWHWGYLAVSVLLPMAVFIIGSLRKALAGIDEDMEPKWWMGPMGDFESYKKARIDWFLIRWLPARNLVTFFCLIILAVNLARIMVG